MIEASTEEGDDAVPRPRASAPGSRGRPEAHEGECGQVHEKGLSGGNAGRVASLRSEAGFGPHRGPRACGFFYTSIY